ncbi:MAG: TraR/DksA family transcriptional regulator [Magnetococcales bacterium]|nr:TraR/DksA family transcriptional regulator [Magnetococcales bacterium]
MDSELNIDITKMRQLLITRQTELMEICATAKESQDPVELDQTKVGRLSRMDAMQMQSMAQETQRRRELELLRIKGALQRLENGDYGYCIKCDEPINEKRLLLEPAIPTCISCARLAEVG